MSGIYIHVPFCATRCIYCDFYSTTLRDKGDLYLEALIDEMKERKDWLHEPVRTVYLGGGTPSQLSPRLIRRLLIELEQCFDLSFCTEVTMEANPEDIVQADYPLELLTRTSVAGEATLRHPVNRISMGVQTMVDHELKMLHRRHNAERVRQAVEKLRKAGIENISLDLMYGLPDQTLESWEYTIDELLKLQPQHISAYNLIVEEGTLLYQKVEQGELQPCDDETCLAMAAMLREKLKAAGFAQYEISNYARPGFESRHNSSYWVQTPYLGLGPGAHSYDGERRRAWNAPDLKSYLAGKREEEYEMLSDLDLYNERVMLGLRTSTGIDLEEKQIAPHRAEIEPVVNQLLERGLMIRKDTRLRLSEAGLALADEVIRDLILLESQE